MKRIAMTLWIAVFVLVWSCVPAWAQATAEISGTVRDQTGAVLPGVDVTATQTDTGIVRTTVTNETGSYVLSNLPLGPYRLEAALPGFRTFAQVGIVLQVGSSLAINPVLGVGQVSDSVEVQANAAMVETRNSGVGQVIENSRILELPLNGRNVTELIALSPGAVQGGSAGIVFNAAFNQSSAITIAGGAPFGVNFQLDGANHNQPVNNLNLSMPFPDALQEFKVETSAMSAQSGIHSAGVVSLVTKSGTNAFHGNAFEFVRNYKFNARNPFALRRDTMKRNQFGGTIGGPILKNKLFFFAGYQGTTIRQAPTDTISFVPTDAMRAGDFTAITSPACNAGRQITLKAPFVDNRIDPARFSPVIVKLLNRPDFPRSSDPCGRTVWGNPDIQNWKFPVGRIDYQRNPHHSIFGRYLADAQANVAPYILTKNLLSLSTAYPVDGLQQAFVFGDTYTFGPAVVNAFRFWASRTAVTSDMHPNVPWKDLGANIYKYTDLSAFITGGPTIANVTGRTLSRQATFGLGNDVNVLRGNHQLSFGFSGQNAFTNLFSQVIAGGWAYFLGQATGLGMGDFLLGQTALFGQASNEYQVGRQWFLGVYGTDSWKATRKLTVNFGLRWEPYFPFQWIDGSAYALSFDDVRKGIRSQQYVNAPPGLSFPGDPNFPGGKNSPWNTRWTNFSPRVGLAWDVNGDGRTSVRAAVGTFYDFVSADYFYGVNYSPPFVTRVSVFDAKIDDPWANYPGGNPYPPSFGRNASFPPSSVYAVLPKDVRNPNVQQWNLSIQRQIGTNWLASASYLGSHTIHSPTLAAVNPAVYIPGASCVLNGVTYSPCSSAANTDQRRVLSLQNPTVGQSFGIVNALDDGATRSYNALILTLQRRIFNGVSTNANYTWSHCIGVANYTIINGGVGNAANTDVNNRNFDSGNCNNDRRHVLNLTASLDTPRFSNRRLNAVAGGWKLAPILRIQSGGFMSITTGRDVSLTGISPQRVSQVRADVYGDRSPSRYLDPAAFAYPQTGTVGNMRLNTIQGPGYWSLDTALSKSFQRTETQRIEFRAEAFNLTNSFRPNNPTSNFDANTFGQILSARDPRIMQFVLKYFF